jgi:e3 binding domain
MATKAKSNGRRASRKPEKYRFAQNVGGEATMPEREYGAYASGDGGDPDVLLDVPVVKVDSIHLELDDLDAHVALKAQVLDLVTLDVGVDVHLGKVQLDVKGVEAQALLKVRLDHVAAIVDRVLTTLDRNPELLESVGQAVEDVGAGAGRTLRGAGEAVEDVGEGAGQAVGDVGQGAGQAVGEIGEGAGQAVGDVGQAVGDLPQAAGQQLGGGSPGASAKSAARTIAQEVGAAASDEAKQLSLATQRKVKELGAKRRMRLAEKHDATDAARELAEELGVDLGEVEGSGADGRITVRDVREASG